MFSIIDKAIAYRDVVVVIFIFFALLFNILTSKQMNLHIFKSLSYSSFELIVLYKFHSFV